MEQEMTPIKSERVKKKQQKMRRAYDKNVTIQNLRHKLTEILRELEIEHEHFENVAAFIDEALEFSDLFYRKQKDYGSKNISKFGELGVLVRSNDKIERLNTIIMSGDANNEPLEDTWKDLCIYSMIGYLLSTNQWNDNADTANSCLGQENDGAARASNKGSRWVDLVHRYKTSDEDSK